MKALVLCAWRCPSLHTTRAVLELLATNNDWRFAVETGDALICRARSTAASTWLTSCPNDDVLVMTDDDFYFTPSGIEALAARARETKGIVAGVTPLRSGEHTAIVPLEPTTEEPWLDPATPATEIKWAGGLIAYHRSVFEKLTHTLPLLHKNDRIPPFWPFFAPAMTNVNGMDIYLSEDYACHERARKLGITVWVEPACQVGHLAEIMVAGGNMSTVRNIFNDPTLGGTFNS